QARGGGALGSFDRNSEIGSEVEPEFVQAPQPIYDDSHWDQIFLPHTWNAHDGSDEVAGYFRGLGWYRKHFVLGEDLRGKRIVLEFEGVNQVSEIWVNGKHVGEHKGGYTGFDIDITDAVRFGAQGNVLAVKVNNLYDKNIGPTIKTDLTFYGGIYRDVWLRITEPVYVAEAYWRTPNVSETSATIDVYASLGNPDRHTGDYQILCEVLDADSNVVGKASTKVSASATTPVKQTIQISNPQLWSTDSPYLYKIRTSVVESSRTWDTSEIPLGLRWYSFDA